MKKRKDQSRLVGNQLANDRLPDDSQTSIPPEEDTPTTARKPSRKRIWLFRFIALTVVPALALGMFELGLRVCGYGYATDFFVIGRESKGRDKTYIENIHFGKRFFPLGLARRPPPTMLPLNKAPGTFRVFVFGESAAMGFPDRTTSFPRILEVMLKDAFPDTRFEVINTAFTAINSHVALPIAKECASHQPDLFVVHLGNNEVLGPFGAGGVLGDYAPNCRLIRASLAVKATRSGQFLERMTRGLLSSETPRVWRGMAMYQGSSLPADDPRIDAMLANYRQNLEDICQCGTAVGAEVVVCTIPVNLRDCAPFASRHRSNLGNDELAKWDAAYLEGIKLEQAGKYAEALVRFQAASTLDDQFADLRFRMARCHLRLRQKEEAQRDYLLARDLDALRFRTDSRFNKIIREVVQEQLPHSHLADAENDFRSVAESEIPGEDLFLEHVHMTFKGNYTLATSVFREVASILAARAGTASKRDVEPLNEQTCAERLAYGCSNRLGTYSTLQRMLPEPPFNSQLDHEERLRRCDARVKSVKNEFESKRKEEIELHENALQASPDDWMIREKYATLLAEYGDADLALKQYQNVLERVPQNYEAWIKMANICVKLNLLNDAEICLRKSLAIDDETALTHYQLAEVLAMKGKSQEGLAIFMKRLQTDPNRAEVLTYLANYYLILGELKEARRCLEDARKINADDPMFHIVLGHVLKEEGDVAGAAEQYELAEKVRPRPRSPGSESVAPLKNAAAQ